MTQAGIKIWIDREEIDPLDDLPAPLSQMLAYTDPARLSGLANLAPWQPAGTRTAGLIQEGIARILCVVGLPALTAAIARKSDPLNDLAANTPPSTDAKAA